MGRESPTHIILIFLSLILTILIIYTIYNYLRTRWVHPITSRGLPEAELVTENLLRFNGGEDLMVHDILEAHGEVVGNSGHGTLYRASISRSHAVVLLRFVRPECAGRIQEILDVVHMLARIRHANLVPLCALYVGPRGEKLFVHPFYGAGNLSSFLMRDKNAESHGWKMIHRVALGISRGLQHLHNGLQRPIIHGNLKTKNILLDSNNQPRLSDFSLHLLLNPTAGQEMLESSAAEGYKAPELIKMKDANKETDIYSLGVILLQMVTQKEPINGHLLSFEKSLLLEDPRRKEEGLVKLFELGMACCSSCPALRPDIKQVVKKLEEIGW